jgi:beta-phosphoglucomutase
LFKAVLFDYDGVIVYTMPYHLRAWQAQFDEYGIKIEPHDVLLREGSIAVNIGRKIFEQNGITISESDLTYFVARKQEKYRRISAAPVAEEVPAFIEFLNSRAIKVGLVTGTDMANVKNIISSELYNKFESIITSEDVTSGKPHPEPYLKGASAIGVMPEKCLVVENAPLGIESAKNAGMTVAAVETTLEKEHLPGADMYFKNVAELFDKWDTVTTSRREVSV